MIADPTTGRAMRALLSAGTSIWTAPDASAKLAKGLAHRVAAAVHYLAPHRSAGLGVSLCPWSTPGCRRGCLYTAGRAGIIRSGERSNAILRARIRRSRAFWDGRAGYIARMIHGAKLHIRSALAAGMVPALRPNGTSDLPWETLAPALFMLGVTVYDYTKSKARALAFASGRMPAAYHLTYSASEQDTESDILAMLRAGVGVAIVYDAPAHVLVTHRGTAYGHRAIDGDESDARFADRERFGIPAGEGYVIALRAKGKARHDRSGFVRSCGGAS